MKRFKRSINTSTGEQSRIALTPEEETLRDESEANAIVKRKAKNDKQKLLHDEKKALQQKLGLTDKEMEILGKAGQIK